MSKFLMGPRPIGQMDRLIKNEKGAILIFTFIILVGLSGVALAFVNMINKEIRSTATQLQNMQAFYIAEAGLAKARRALTTGGQDDSWGETDEPFGEGTYTVEITDNGDDTYTIESEGYIPNDTNPIAKRKVKEEDISLTSGVFTNLSLAATASASSEQGGNTADKANDGESNTKWMSSVNNGSCLKIDFGSSTTFDKIIYDGSKIDSYTIEYSDNDSDCDTDWPDVEDVSESPTGTVTFTPVLGQYLRFSVNGNNPSVNELESYDIAGGGETVLGQGRFVTYW